MRLQDRFAVRQPAVTDGYAGLGIGPDTGMYGPRCCKLPVIEPATVSISLLADRGPVNKAGDSAHAMFPFDPDPSFRIFITCSSA
ncbi:MAG TPA: hypothetical protein VLN61_03160 [Pseudolabrys sp.]|nr:hypothetical protein [Pseudolabrys sp.]